MSEPELDPTQTAPDGDRIHASCVALDGVGVLFIGASGSGKSSTALAMIAHGATLVSDDQTRLSVDGDKLIAHAIEGYEGMIEARGVGILKTSCRPQVRVAYVVDMDNTELHRLPPNRVETLMGLDVPSLYGRENAFLVPSLLTLMRGERLK